MDTPLYIISGRSGSGKSYALNTLEDSGFYSLDNLPVTLIPDAVEKILSNLESSPNFAGIAIGIDVRNAPHELQQFSKIVAVMQDLDIEPRVIFLDCETDTLIERFSETRRKHPLSGDSTALREAIISESEQLDTIAHMADLRIDTSHTTVHELRAIIKDKLIDHLGSSLCLTVQSFGFKHGVPNDSDFVFDVRCLPNPHWDVRLRDFTGIDQPIIDFLSKESLVDEMRNDILAISKRWIPRFEGENRSYFTISIGCTGGKHRSVFLAEAVARELSSLYPDIIVRHRERNRWPKR
ncbi:MAG: RNase adapter RapZ [Gammaproteobacteria bacterium]|nr:RNase adapter RapZ [Gammaproteobacteria bacterium]